jgi:hypothetical protein
MFTDEQGNFTPDFQTKLPEFLGDDHKDFKGFEDVKNIGQLAKMYADTKRMVGKKLDNVIQKPGEKATDEEKAAYRAQLAKEMGVPDKPEAYQFQKPQLPEGMSYDEEFESAIKPAMLAAGITPDGANKLYDAYNQFQTQRFQAAQEAMQQQFDNESATLKKAWPGTAFMENSRLAFNALNEYATDELRDMLKTAGVYDDPTNLQKWMKIGISPQQLSIWGNIGKRLKSAPIPSGGSAPDKDDNGPRAQAMRAYPNSPELWPKA